MTCFNDTETCREGASNVARPARGEKEVFPRFPPNLFIFVDFERESGSLRSKEADDLGISVRDSNWVVGDHLPAKVRRVGGGLTPSLGLPVAATEVSGGPPNKSRSRGKKKVFDFFTKSIILPSGKCKCKNMSVMFFL